MKASRIIEFCAGLEQKLDERLFAKPEDEKEGIKKTTAGAVATSAVAGGGYLAHRSIMDKFGGNASGSAANAYREAGRNLIRSGTQIGKTVGTEVSAGVKQGIANAKVSLGRSASSGRPLLTRITRAGKAGTSPLLARLAGLVGKLK